MFVWHVYGHLWNSGILKLDIMITKMIERYYVNDSIEQQAKEIQGFWFKY